MSHSESINQYFAAISVNILSLGVGASISWTSPYLSVLQSELSPLDKPITSSQASWIGSLLAIGALFGSFFYGWLSEKLGRQKSLMSAAIPQIIWWIILIFSRTANWLLLGRFLAGFSAGGSFTLVPLYVAEISQTKIRGSLGSFFILSTNLGMLLTYIAGCIFDYSMAPKVMLLLPATFFLLIAYLPETPIYLLRNNKLETAEASLKFLRGCNKHDTISDDLDLELQKMIRKVNSDAVNERSSGFSELDSIAAKKGVFIGIILISVNQLSGLFAFLNYTAETILESGSVFNPNASAVIVGALLFAGSLFSITIVDKFSRRFLYSITTVGYMIGLIAMGVYSYLKTSYDVSSFKFVPVASLSLIIFAASLGRLPLSYIIMAEIIPQNIKSFGVAVCTTSNWILAFLLLRFFTKAVGVLQFHNCMFLCCGFTFIGMLFVIFYVPETKGRSFEEIEKSLTDKTFTYRPTKSSEKEYAENV